MHDVFIHNAVIHDGERFTDADALLVKAGRISWIGPGACAPAHDGVPSVDLEGRTVLPALCDVHTHPSWIAATVRSVPCVSPIVNTIEEMIEALRRHPLAGRGPEAWITGFGYDEGKLAVYREAARRGFPVRAGLYLVWKGGRDPRGMPALTDEDRTGDHFIAGVKLFADGSVSGATAAVTTPFLNGSTGMVTLDDGALEAAAEYARTNKIQLSVHAMGDRAVGRIIDFFEDQTPWLEDRPSVRIEHATFLNEAQLARMNASAMRFGVTTQVIFPYAEIEGYRAVLAPKDLERVYPVRTVSSALDAFALSSDAPATAWADPDDPFVSMGAAVTRTAWDGTVFNRSEAVSCEEAVSLYTSRPMKVLPFEGVGRLAPGMRADFIVLRDPVTDNGEALARNAVSEVFRAGALIHRAPR